MEVEMSCGWVLVRTISVLCLGEEGGDKPE